MLKPSKEKTISFVVCMKSIHNNFPYSLLQLFDFGTSITDALAEASEDEPEEEVATEPQAEAHLNADSQSN